MDPTAQPERIQLLSINEACRRLSVSRSHLYEIIGSGRLTIRKLGAASRLRSDELDAYIVSLPSTSIATRERR